MVCSIKVISATCALYACLALSHAGVIPDHGADYFLPAKYSYEYDVSDSQTGDQKSMSESRDGDVVKGHYSFVEADGTTRTVHYTADNSGFHAHVSNSGHASVHAPQGEWSAPAPAPQAAVEAAPWHAVSQDDSQGHAEWVTPAAPAVDPYTGTGHEHGAPLSFETSLGYGQGFVKVSRQ